MSILLGVALASTIIVGLSALTTQPHEGESKPHRDESMAMKATPSKTAEAESSTYQVEVSISFAAALIAGLAVFEVVRCRASQPKA